MENLPARTDPPLAEQAKDLSRQTPRDHVTAAVKAALNAVPVVGGPLASLVSDYIPTSRAERIEKFAQAVAKELERVAERADVEYVRTDEFAYLFTRAFEGAARDYQAEKLEAYRNILVNALVVDVPASVKESYLNRVENLTPLHLQVLAAFRSDAENAARLARLSRGFSGSLSITLSRLAPEVPSEMLPAVVHDLDVQGITSQVASMLNVTMTSSGATELEGRLTPFGRGFVDFIGRSH